MEDRPTSDAWSSPPTEPPPPPATPAPPVIAWEDPSRPWFTAFVETVREFFTGPRRAFARVPVNGDVLRPLLFAILVGWIGQFFFSMWELTLIDPLRGLMPGNQFGADDEIPRGYWFAVMALAPLFTAMGLVFSSAVVHVFLLLFGGARNGFTATFRALCYVQAGALLLIVPFCGGLFAGAFMLVLEVLGLSTLHRISLGKAAAAVLLPTFLCCACLCVLFLMVGAAAMSALGGITP